jgi:hypothetical protein
MLGLNGKEEKKEVKNKTAYEDKLHFAWKEPYINDITLRIFVLICEIHPP